MALNLVSNSTNGDGAKKRKRSDVTKRTLAKLRKEYLEKSLNNDFDNFGVCDFQFFWCDLFRVRYGIRPPRNNAAAANTVFSGLLEEYGANAVAGIILSSFQYTEEPEDIWWYKRQRNMTRLIKNFKHYRELAEPHFEVWKKDIRRTVSNVK